MISEALPILARWLHIGPVIIAIGGAFFMRFVLLPSMGETLAEDHSQRLRSAMMTRWRKWVHICIGLILLSGLFNIYHAAAVLRESSLYQILFVVKLLAAVGVFMVASVLVGRSEGFGPMRANPRKWLAVIVGLAAAIVIVSGIMKNIARPLPVLGPIAALPLKLVISEPA